MNIFINDKEVNVLNAPNINSTLDETRDTGTLTLELSDIKECFKPFSKVKIIHNNDIINFVVTHDEVSIASKFPITYIHELLITQNTIIFDKTQIRNTVFSQPAKPIQSIVYNTTLQNIGDNNLVYFITNPLKANTLTIPSKYKIGSASVVFDLARMSASASDSNYVLDHNFTIPNISFDLYSGDSLLTTYSFNNVKNGDSLTINKSIFGSDTSYTIKNVVVKSVPKVSSLEYFKVGINLNLGTYIYTLYDILDILRKQIAMNEFYSTSVTLAPIINIKKTYVASSSGYEISFTITNPNNRSAKIDYNAFGSFIKSGTMQVGANSTSSSVILGVGSSISGYVEANALIDNILSTKETAYYSLKGIVPPTLSWFPQGITGEKYRFTNTNEYAVILNYKVYKEGTTIAEYEQVVLDANGGQFTSSGLFNNCRVYYDYYCTKDLLISENVKGEIIIGTIPTLSAPQYDGNTIVIESGATYVISNNIKNTNTVACKLYYRTDNTDYTIVDIAPNETITATKNELISQTSAGNMYAYFKSENYENSSIVSKSWGLPTLIVSGDSFVEFGGSKTWIVRASDDRDLTGLLSAVSSRTDIANVSISGSSVIVSAENTIGISTITVSASGFKDRTKDIEVQASSKDLLPINLSTATLDANGTLTIRYVNNNQVAVSGKFYYQGGAYSVDKTFSAGANNLIIENVPLSDSSCFVGPVSAVGYNSSTNSNTLTYTAPKGQALSSIVLKSATLDKYGDLRVYYSNPNNVEVSGTIFYGNTKELKTFVANATTNYFLFPSVGLESGSVYVGPVSASGFTSSSISNVVYYSFEQDISTTTIPGSFSIDLIDINNGRGEFKITNNSGLPISAQPTSIYINQSPFSTTYGKATIENGQSARWFSSASFNESDINDADASVSITDNSGKTITLDYHR